MWRFRGFPKCLPQTVDGGIYAMVEIKVSIFGPESQAQLIASDEFAVALEEYAENLKRLTGEPQAYAVLAQLLSAQVGLEWSEVDNALRT
jgi:hypothetical protein